MNLYKNDVKVHQWKSRLIFNLIHFSIFRQKLRKYIKTDFEEDVAKFRENPDEDDDADEIQAQEEKEDKDDDDEIDSDTEVINKSEFMKSADTFKKGTFKI